MQRFRPRVTVASRWLILAPWAFGLSAAHAQQARPEVTIDPGGVPAAVLQAVTRSVDHIVSLSQDQDGGEIDRLRRRVRDVTITALATEGYFSPEVTLDVGEDVGGETWDIAIQPGERTVVSTLDLGFSGAIELPAYAERVSAMRNDWRLPVGQPLRSEQWETAKRELIGSVSERDFALARIQQSQARVDADAAQADLTVQVESGPQVVLGELEIIGLRRVPESLIRRYVAYQPNETRYDRRQLIRWQQDMQSTPFFSSVDVGLTRSTGRRTIQQVADSAAQAEGAGDLDAIRRTPASQAAAAEVPDDDEDDDDAQTRDTASEAPAGQAAPRSNLMQRERLVVPVRVSVTEAPARRVGAAIGVDTDVGLRVEGTYRQNIVAGLPVELQSGIGIDADRQTAFADFYLPPSPKGYRDRVGVLAEHNDIQGQDVRRVALGGVRNRIRPAGDGSRVEYETNAGLVAAYDDVRVDGGESYTLPSLTATYQWLRRDVDSKYNPRQGHLIDLGVGVGSSVRDFKPYSRLQARGQYWWPIGARDLVTVRGEVGKVWSGGNTRIPADFGFRTGGARTIRGYRYLGLGIDDGNAVVAAPALAVASVEYQHFFTDMLGVGVFVDAGDAAASFRDMDIAWSVGSGLRVRTPAGPIFVDLAWADRDKRLRLSFSLGLAF
ncbi:BamA/TamA family outer membrane protein [Achromobacter sp. GG226]|uniref:autotransporter assembly complex protein TamA n=1 Tax=Verticiella alkaliphila TaxID=2779529 RepID=UPI001C0AE890|nr:BamA/TamA family outer membrane protein [Verticiella sp. GG226]MBU4609340.1 BamA/TamA family outer membrane protein [Verticiella sp. GG226]